MEQKDKDDIRGIVASQNEELYSRLVTVSIISVFVAVVSIAMMRR
jgi:hypothetical protein